MEKDVESYEVILLNRIGELERARDQSLANHNAVSGALQEARHALDLFKKSNESNENDEEGKKSVA